MNKGTDMNIVEKYVADFNLFDNELYKSEIDNAHALEWMMEEIPILECPDKDIERTYYFRWWTYRKHIKNTVDGYVVTEFLPDVPWAGRHNIINAPVGHHISEGRWLKNSHKYLDSYIELLLSGYEDVKSHQYSTWLIYSIVDFYKTSGMPGFADEILKKSCDYYKLWEIEHKSSNGMFWSVDLPDAMEYSISGRNGLKATKGFRPTLNSYMYADCVAISELAHILGEQEIEKQYAKKANELRKLINEKLCVDGFYRAFHDKDDNLDNVFNDNNYDSVRELIGYIPWMFNIPVKKDVKSFDCLLDEKVFYSTFGLTTADQSNERFLYKANHECLWNGYVWPFATSQVLTALRNVIWNYNSNRKYKKMFIVLLKQYAKSHTITDETGNVLPWIDEMRHPYIDEWTTRQWLSDHNYPDEKGPIERGKDYNHSTFCDLVLTGIAGVRNDKKELYIEPNIPNDWGYFKISNLWFRGRRYSISYKNGSWTID